MKSVGECGVPGGGALGSRLIESEIGEGGYPRIPPPARKQRIRAVGEESAPPGSRTLIMWLAQVRWKWYAGKDKAQLRTTEGSVRENSTSEAGCWGTYREILRHR